MLVLMVPERVQDTCGRLPSAWPQTSPLPAPGLPSQQGQCVQRRAQGARGPLPPPASTLLPSRSCLSPPLSSRLPSLHPFPWPLPMCKWPEEKMHILSSKGAPTLSFGGSLCQGGGEGTGWTRASLRGPSFLSVGGDTRGLHSHRGSVGLLAPRACPRQQVLPRDGGRAVSRGAVALGVVCARVPVSRCQARSPLRSRLGRAG